jgi:hypothetical protein
MLGCCLGDAWLPPEEVHGYGSIWITAAQGLQQSGTGNRLVDRYAQEARHEHYRYSVRDAQIPVDHRLSESAISARINHEIQIGRREEAGPFSAGSFAHCCNGRRHIDEVER